MHHRQPHPQPGTQPQRVNLRPAVIFDRDGVVNACPGPGRYVLDWSQFHFNEGILEALQLCRRLGYFTLLATSQQGVGKALMSQQDLDDIHQRMQQNLQAHDAAFDDIRACTCLQSDPQCRCRKPSPQMLIDAAGQHQLDLGTSILIGDAARDIAMGRAAGVPCCIRILGTKDEKDDPPAEHQLLHTRDLPSLLQTLLTKRP